MTWTLTQIFLSHRRDTHLSPLHNPISASPRPLLTTQECPGSALYWLSRGELGSATRTVKTRQKDLSVFHFWNFLLAGSKTMLRFCAVLLVWTPTVLQHQERINKKKCYSIFEISEKPSFCNEHRGILPKSKSFHRQAWSGVPLTPFPLDVRDTQEKSAFDLSSQCHQSCCTLLLNDEKLAYRRLAAWFLAAKNASIHTFVM